MFTDGSEPPDYPGDDIAIELGQRHGVKATWEQNQAKDPGSEPDCAGHNHEPHVGLHTGDAAPGRVSHGTGCTGHRGGVD